MKKWSWACPISGCGAHGLKWISHRGALHNGKWHITRVHNQHHVDPIIVKKPKVQAPLLPFIEAIQ